MVRKHLEDTRHYQMRGKNRPPLERGSLKLSIQHGGIWFSSTENGVPHTVQIASHNSEFSLDFEKTFLKYRSKSGLGYLNVPVSELDEFLTNINPDEASQKDDLTASGDSDTGQDQEEHQNSVSDSVDGDGTSGEMV